MDEQLRKEYDALLANMRKLAGESIIKPKLELTDDEKELLKCVEQNKHKIQLKRR